MKKITNGLLIALAILTSSASHADRFSMKLFSVNQGEHIGTRSDGSKCILNVVPGYFEGYRVEMSGMNDGEKYEEDASATSGRNLIGQYDRYGFKKYVSAINGGWINSSGSVTKKWEMRVYFDGNNLTSYSITYHWGSIECTLK